MVQYAYSPKYNYIIGWNPKSGCSSFRDLFLHLHKDEVSKISNGRHLINLDFPLPRNIDNIPIYILVRNPYERIVSCFKNKYCGPVNTAQIRKNMKLDKCNFVSFISALAHSQNINKVDLHVQEQTFNLLPNAKI